jgi:hypothetical protein
MPESPRAQPSRRIAVSPWLLAGLGSALLLCLLAIAWLLGKESGRRLADKPRSATTAEPSPPGFERLPSRATRTAREAPAGVASASATPEGTPPPAAPEASPGAPAAGEATAVARYFAELEAFSSARYWDDPEGLALSIVQELVAGGSSRIDRLRQVQAEVEAGVRAMSVPEPCREHHQRSLASFAAAAQLLDAISGAAASGDLAGVTAAAAEAERLQASALELQELENALRSRYGLPPAPS